MNLAHNANVSRLIAAAAASAITFTLFSSVVSISEPQRSQLMALNQKHQAANVAKAQTKSADARLAAAGRAVETETLASR